ncbi:MAG: hypothetical protein H0T60_04330 [Acidobacteria bacterium]|nr:hypothetical protein [Acidobacteriota bacterium]
MLVPEKQTVYPEYMPDELVRVRRESRQDQLLGYLRQHSDLRILDLRPALSEAKAKNRIYHRTDTHWNDVGAFTAYQAIVRALGEDFPEMQPLPATEFEVVPSRTHAGDLAVMLGLHATLTEEELNLRPRAPLQARLADGSAVSKSTVGNPGQYVSERKGEGLPRLVMLSDSFATVFIPFLAEHFSRGVYRWDIKTSPSIDAERSALIEAERPNIVILEMVERFLMTPPPTSFSGRAQQ